MGKGIGHISRVGLVLGLAAATLGGALTPTLADSRGGAIAAGVIGGAALGALAGSAAAGAYGPPPGYYPPPPPPARYVEPVDVPPPPPRCHREYVRTWDPYAGVYVDRPQRVCDAY